MTTPIMLGQPEVGRLRERRRHTLHAPIRLYSASRPAEDSRKLLQVSEISYGRQPLIGTQIDGCEQLPPL